PCTYVFPFLFVCHVTLSTYLAADVPFRFSALTGSCVVIPCSIPYQEDEPFTRGIWSKRNNDIIYHNGQTFVVDHFKGRTRMLGDLNEGNCSLEIDDIKPFDNGPFCFHAERHDKERYRFNNSCVFIVMKASPDKPMMTSVPAEVDAGSTITVSCSVTHTCPSHPPVFSWSVPHLTSEVTHTWTPQGIWETTSTITFMAAGGDGVKNLTCTAISWGGKPISFVGLISCTLKSLMSCNLFYLKSFLFIEMSRRNPEDRERPPRPEKRYVSRLLVLKTGQIQETK
uniref:Si:dkey-238d18.7 n=1 Tax=Sander lucioperca TaxID=283035 RepID=A0A8C9Z5L9_SANLU